MEIVIFEYHDLLFSAGSYQGAGDLGGLTIHSVSFKRIKTEIPPLQGCRLMVLQPRLEGASFRSSYVSGRGMSKCNMHLKRYMAEVQSMIPEAYGWRRFEATIGVSFI